MDSSAVQKFSKFRPLIKISYEVLFSYIMSVQLLWRIKLTCGVKKKSDPNRLLGRGRGMAEQVCCTVRRSVCCTVCCRLKFFRSWAWHGRTGVYMCVFVRVYMSVCVVNLCLCMYACYVYTCTCMYKYTCVHMYIYACTYIYMYIYMYTYMYAWVTIEEGGDGAQYGQQRTTKAPYLYIYVCMYIYIIYIYIYIMSNTWRRRRGCAIWSKKKYQSSRYICIYIYIHVGMYCHVCETAEEGWEGEQHGQQTTTQAPCIYMYAYLYLYLYICVCVFVSMYVLSCMRNSWGRRRGCAAWSTNNYPNSVNIYIYCMYVYVSAKLEEGWASAEHVQNMCRTWSTTNYPSSVYMYVYTYYLYIYICVYNYIYICIYICMYIHTHTYIYMNIYLYSCIS